jgi:hypothetical protein
MIKKLLVDYCRRSYFGNNNYPVQIGKYHASVLSWNCLRKQWNYYKEYSGKKPEEIPDDTILLLSGGIVFHRLIQSLKENEKLYWSEIEVKCSIEVKIKEGNIIKIVGCADAIREEGTKKIIYEFKHTRYIPQKPYFQHILQINFYMGALNIKNGVLLYVGYLPNGGLDIKEFPIEYSDWHMQQIINRAQILHTFLVNNIPPCCSCKDKKCEKETINKPNNTKFRRTYCI